MKDCWSCMINIDHWMKDGWSCMINIDHCHESLLIMYHNCWSCIVSWSLPFFYPSLSTIQLQIRNKGSQMGIQSTTQTIQPPKGKEEKRNELKKEKESRLQKLRERHQWWSLPRCQFFGVPAVMDNVSRRRAAANPSDQKLARTAAAT